MDGTWIEIVLNFGRVLFGIWLGTTAAVGFALCTTWHAWEGCFTPWYHSRWCCRRKHSKVRSGSMRRA